jgi:3-oxoacyl-[acyl-carrier-protein] synthase-3
MRYSRVYLESMGYEMAPVVVTTRELEGRLAPAYEKLKIPEGQFEMLTGIKERRWWEPGFPPSKGAIAAAKKALAASNVKPEDIGIFIYASVCREGFEPATACKVADALGIGPDAKIYDISNACLAAVNGIINIANSIELGHCRAGLVVSCESAREVNEVSIKRILENPSMEKMIEAITTFTGGSGASAILLSDGSFSNPTPHQLIGGASCVAPEFHGLCRWWMEPTGKGIYEEIASTDSMGVLKNGLGLVKKTWKTFEQTLGWSADKIDKTVCHQVAAKNREELLKITGISEDKDFITYPYLGNMGTASLPMSAAIAEEEGFLRQGDNVAFGGIGSGLNCMILGWKW